MLEVRTFDGDAHEIARFTQEVWRTSYYRKVPTPVWDENYFDWQLLSERPGGSDYLVAAYEGGKLVGSLFAEEFKFRLREEEFKGAFSSWLTVHPDYRRRGLGKQLAEEQCRRLLERDAKFLLGFGIKSKNSSGPKFWASFSEKTVLLGQVGLWIRMLDHRAVSEWDVSLFNRLGSRLLGVVQRKPSASRQPTSIRCYRPDDLPACLELINNKLDEVDMGCVWSAARLAHQLDYKGIPSTLVAESSGRVAGLINYYKLTLLGRSYLEAAVIDHFVTDNLTWRERSDLLETALAQMQAEGIKLALTLRLPTSPNSLLLANGFIPLLPEHEVICYRADKSFCLDKAKRLYVYLR